MSGTAWMIPVMMQTLQRDDDQEDDPRDRAYDRHDRSYEHRTDDWRDASEEDSSLLGWVGRLFGVQW